MDNFAGDKKVGQSILGPLETKFKNWAVPKLPSWVETHHLTLTTIIWSLLNLVWGFLAGKYSLHWLWMVSIMIILQYITDLFDGALGRMKDTGLVKWGFYMDHFLDYVFLCSLVTAGFFIAPSVNLHLWYVLLLIIMGCFMVNSFLTFAATNRFEIFHFGIGPTETRLVFILINTIIIFTGREHFAWSVPVLVMVCLAALIIQVLRSHRMLWKIDEEAKGSPIPGPKAEIPGKPEESEEPSETEEPSQPEETSEEKEPEKPDSEEEIPEDNTAPEPEKEEEAEKKPRKKTSRKKTAKKKSSGRKKTKKTECD
jgi:phosphatidylglycerophosphate synthase